MLAATDGKLWRSGPEKGYWIGQVRSCPERLEWALEELAMARKARAVPLPAAWIRGAVRKKFEEERG